MSDKPEPETMAEASARFQEAVYELLSALAEAVGFTKAAERYRKRAAEADESAGFHRALVAMPPCSCEWKPLRVWPSRINPDCERHRAITERRS